LFVKRGPGVSRPELEQFLNGLASKHFSAPKFLWHFRVAGVRVGAWEFVEGRSPSFSESAPGDISRVIEAVAGVSSVPESAVRHLGVPLRIPYVHPVAERAAAAMSTALREDSAIQREVAADLADFAQVEGGLITRYHTLPHRCLTHNDIKPANLLIRSGDERLVIADWNSARVGVPGASLRFLATWSPDVQTKVAEHYVEHMGRLGVRLAVADVLFAMIATYVFKGLHEAVDAADVRKLRATLDRAARLAEADLSKSASLIGAS
jgi:thiamine kinase-like enzyme